MLEMNYNIGDKIIYNDIISAAEENGFCIEKRENIIILIKKDKSDRVLERHSYSANAGDGVLRNQLVEQYEYNKEDLASKFTYKSGKYTSTSYENNVLGIRILLLEDVEGKTEIVYNENLNKKNSYKLSRRSIKIEDVNISINKMPHRNANNALETCLSIVSQLEDERNIDGQEKE